MQDPREAKLPKWAQRMLKDERIKSALSWPTVSQPAPVAIYNDGCLLAGTEIRYAVVWCESLKSGMPVDVLIMSGEQVLSNGKRLKVTGAFFETKRDVLVAQLWRDCRLAAEQLSQKINQIEEEAARVEAEYLRREEEAARRLEMQRRSNT